MTGLLLGLAVVVTIGGTASRNAQAVLPSLPNTVQQWNKIAEDTVVGSGAFQGEGEVYMAYTSTAVYDAVVAIQGGYQPYGPAIGAPTGASVDCAVVEAAYRTLRHYFQSNSTLVATLDGYSRGRARAVCPRRMHRRRRKGDGRRARGRERHHRPAHRRRATDADRDDVGVSDEGPRSGGVAAHAGG